MKRIIAIILVLITLPTSIIYASEEVILGGDSIGIEAKYDGLYISGTYTLSDNNNTYDNNKTLRNGDVLIAIEGKRITDLNTFNTIIQSYKETQTLNVTIIRNQSYFEDFQFYFEIAYLFLSCLLFSILLYYCLQRSTPPLLCFCFCF